MSIAKRSQEDSGEKFGLSCMTKESIVKLCKKNRLYITPHLNDVLYLHYQGYQKIEALEEYTGLKCLWLESNAISEFSGLDTLSNLRCLFVHNNLIKRIENLEHCPRLDTLNCSHNYITTIENCGSGVLPELSTLNISHNRLRTSEQLAQLIDCRQLSVLDMSHNRIDDIMIVNIVAQMPELRVLVLTGNPVVSMIPMYRKTMINECKMLTYLDSRPVFERDRACAVAWKNGGYEEERKVHERFNKAERRKIRDGVNATLALRNKNAIAKGLKPEFELIVSSDDEDDQLKSICADPKAAGDSADLSPKSDKYHYCTKCMSNDCKYKEQCPKHVYDEVAGDDPLQKELYEEDCSNLYNNEYYNQLVDDLNQTNVITIDDPQTENEIAFEAVANECSINSSESSVDPYANIMAETLTVIEQQKQLYKEPDAHERSRQLIQELSSKTAQEEQENTERILSAIAQEDSSVPIVVIANRAESEDDRSSEDVKSEDEDEAEKIEDKSTNKSEYEDDDDDDEDRYSNIDDVDSVHPQTSSKVGTIRGFIQEFTEFLETREEKAQLERNRLEGLETEACKRQKNADNELEIDEIPDLDEIHKDLLLDPSNPLEAEEDTPKGELIERLLESRPAIFDIPADELNREVAALGENSHNSLVEMIDRVYQNREAYHNPDEESSENEDAFEDAEDNVTWITNYYEAFVPPKKCADKKKMRAIKYECDMVENAKPELIASDSSTDQADSFETCDIIEECSALETNTNEEAVPLSIESNDDPNSKVTAITINCETLDNCLADTDSQKIQKVELISSDSIDEEIVVQAEIESLIEETGQASDVAEFDVDKNDDSIVNVIEYEEHVDKLDDLIIRSAEEFEMSVRNNETAESIDDKPTIDLGDTAKVEREFLESVEANRTQLHDSTTLHDRYVEAIIKDVIPTVTTPKLPTQTPTPCNEIPSSPKRETLPILEPRVQTPASGACTNAASCSFDLKYLQSVVYGGPRLQDAVRDEPALVAGDFGIEAADIDAVNAEIRESPEFRRHLERMEQLDRGIEEGIRRIMLDASIEFGMLNDLEKYGDPNGDEETDLLKRVEQYAAEFKGHLSEEHRKGFHSL